MPAVLFTCDWMMPGISYSTGSSMVVVFFSGTAMRLRVENDVKDLPEPVGPVTRKMPLGLWMVSR